MTDISKPNRIHILGDNLDYMLSTQILLETENYSVSIISSQIGFSNLQNFQESDVIILNVDRNSFELFRLLNTLMLQITPPYIIVITDQDFGLKPSDQFFDRRVKILAFPVSSKDLLKAISETE